MIVQHKEKILVFYNVLKSLIIRHTSKRLQYYLYKLNSTILIDVEIADDLQEQITGLMFRQNLGYYEGMLFVYDTEKKRSFWMKNTLISLDMLFVDANNRIIDIKENIQPCVIEICPNYTSKSPAKYVLEVNAGFTLMNNIKVGNLIT